MHRVPPTPTEKMFHVARYNKGLFRDERQYAAYLRSDCKPKSMSEEDLERFNKRFKSSPESGFFHVNLAAVTKCMYLVSVVWNSNWYKEKFLSILFSTFAPFEQNIGAADIGAKRESIFLIADGDLHAENLVEMFDAICQFTAEQIMKEESGTDLSSISPDSLQKKIATSINVPLRKFAREACLVDNAIVDDQVEWLRQHAAKYILYKDRQGKEEKLNKCALSKLPVDLQQWFITRADSVGERWFQKNDYTFLLGIRACGVEEEVISNDDWFKLTNAEKKIGLLNRLFDEGKIHFRIERWRAWAEKAAVSHITEQEFTVARQAVANMVNKTVDDSKDIDVLGKSVIIDLNKSKGINIDIRSFLSGEPGVVNEFLEKRIRSVSYLLKESDIVPRVSYQKGIELIFYPLSDEPKTMKFFRGQFESEQSSLILKGWQQIDPASSKKLSSVEFVNQSKGINCAYFDKPEEVLKLYYMAEDEQFLYTRNCERSSELAFVNSITSGGIHNREGAESAINALTTYLTHHTDDGRLKRNSSNSHNDKERAKEEFIKSMEGLFDEKVKKLKIVLEHIISPLQNIPDITNEQRALFIIKPANQTLQAEWICKNLEFLLKCDLSSSGDSSFSGVQVVWQFCRKIIILTCVYAMREFYQKHSNDDKSENVWARICRAAQAEIEAETSDVDEMPWFLRDDNLSLTDKTSFSTNTRNFENGYLIDKIHRKKVLNKICMLLVRAGYRLPTRETRIELRGQAMSVILKQYVAQFTNSDLELFEGTRLTVDIAKKIADTIASEIWVIVIDLIKDEINPPPFTWVRDNTDESDVKKDTGAVFFRPVTQIEIDTDSDIAGSDGLKSEEDLEYNTLFNDPQIVVNLSVDEKFSIDRYIEIARNKAQGCFDKAVRQLEEQCIGLQNGELRGVFLNVSTRYQTELTEKIHRGSVSSDSVNGGKLPTQTNANLFEIDELSSNGFTFFTQVEHQTAFNERGEVTIRPNFKS
jgi:hypothetical protein